ncbi:MAG: SLC13 family permease [Candidatus Omnitrophota bacterium]|nr:SLC13 family permease [Candidatus Omnitrophota bacterium]
MLKKFIILIALSLGLGFLTVSHGFNFHQSVSISIFSVAILGSLLFWDFRLTFVFIGTALLLITKTISLNVLLEYSSLEVILFLVGMMVLIGFLKEAGFFAWLVSLILRIKNLTANKFLILISAMAALSACVIDEVTSIIFIVAAIFEICDYFEVDPTPFLIISVFATNIGSSGTTLGNPIGILIASKSGLTFEDFMLKAFPVMLVCLVVTIAVVRYWYRRELSELDKKMKKHGANEIFIKLISVPPDKSLKVGLSIFALTLLFISLHHRLELILGLAPNTILFATPFLTSGGIMAWRHARARKYIEKDVEWWTLLFFMLLFAQAGTLKYTGATDVLAKYLVTLTKNNTHLLTGLILWISAVGSSVLDNVVLVASFIPVVQGFKGLGMSIQPLWWALLFGGCFGGNITLIGSTANIVALGILEKEKKMKVKFFQWFWVGLIVGVITTMIVWGFLLVLPMYR